MFFFSVLKKVWRCTSECNSLLNTVLNTTSKVFKPAEKIQPCSKGFSWEEESERGGFSDCVVFTAHFFVP